MKVVDTPQDMRELAEVLRRDDAPLGLVPTMGALHEGHKSLIVRATEECGAAVVSIFVNPAQFAAGEDYDTYPRTFEADMEACREMGVSCVYAPKASSMYPGVIRHLGGRARPGSAPLREPSCRPFPRRGHGRAQAVHGLSPATGPISERRITSNSS